MDIDTGEIKGEIIKNGETGEYTGWSEGSDGTQYKHDYTEIDPTDGFPIGKTETIKPGTDYTIITDTSEDGESTTIDPNSGKEVNVPPSGAGC